MPDEENLPELAIAKQRIQFGARTQVSKIEESAAGCGRL
jgi:hypothetical protein